MEKIRPFDNNVESIYDWITRFELKAELHGVDQSIMEKWARVTIGRIGEVVLKNTSFANWSQVKTHLERSLGTRDIAKRSVQELKTLQQKSDENIRQVGARAICLAKQAFPGTPENIQEREAVTAFIASQPQHIQFELIKANCANVSDVCTLAELLVEAHRQTGGTIGAATAQVEDAEIKALQEEMKQMKLQMQNNLVATATEQRSSETERRPLICDYCQKRGHARRQCRKRQWDERNQGNAQRWQTTTPRDNQGTACLRCGEPNHIQRHCTARPGNAQRAILGAVNIMKMVRIGHEPVKLLVDTGAEASCLNKATYNRLRQIIGPLQRPEIQYFAADGQKLRMEGIAKNVKVNWEGKDLTATLLVL